MKGYKEMSFRLLGYLIDSHKNCRKNMGWVIFQMVCLATIIIANWNLIGLIEKSLPWSLLFIIVLTTMLCLIIILGETHKIKILKKGFEPDESKKKS